METTKATFFTARAKAFAGQGVRDHRVGVYADGTIRVWDPVANHYTVCHSLGRGAITRLRKMAREKT